MDGSNSEDVNEAITYSVYGAPPPPRLIIDDDVTRPTYEGCPLCPDCPAGHECAPSNQTRQQHRVLIQQLNNNKGIITFRFSGVLIISQLLNCNYYWLSLIVDSNLLKVAKLFNGKIREHYCKGNSTRWATAS